MHTIKQHVKNVIKKNQIVINLMTNITAMSIGVLISLWITPYLINKLGFAAYGYIGIINNLIAFMTVLTYALNSMSGRFLTVSYNKTGAGQASNYISSALFANLFAGFFLLLLVVVLTMNLNRIINIKAEFDDDVKLAFFLGGVAFILSSISIIFSTAAYSKNRLDIINGYNIFSNTIRAIFLISVFSFFKPRIWHYASASILQVSLTIVMGALSFKLLLPDVRFDIKLINLQMSSELLFSGFFNSVIMLGNVFITQIDLIVGNRYLPADVVGMYAAILLIPSSIRNISVALSSAFSPTTMILYSNGNLQKLREYSNRVVKLCGLMLGWPIAILSGLAIPILKIWLNKDYSNYEFTIILMLLPMTVHLAVSQLYNVQQAFNKVKIPAIASVVLGVSNLILAVYFTSSLGMGVFGIVLSGILISTLRTVVFIPIYTAIITNQKILMYHKGLIAPLMISATTCAAGIVMQRHINITTISTIFYSAFALSVLYLSIAAILLIYTEREGFRQNVVPMLRRLYTVTTK